MSQHKETPLEGGVQMITDPQSGITAKVATRVNVGELQLRDLALVVLDDEVYAITVELAEWLSDHLHVAVERLRQRQNRRT